MVSIATQPEKPIWLNNVSNGGHGPLRVLVRGGKEVERGPGEKEILEAVRILCTDSREHVRDVWANTFQVSERQWATGRCLFVAMTAVG